MGSVFSSPSPPPPPPPPKPKKKAKDDADARKERLERQRRGLSSTVRTSQRGILAEAAPPQRKSLLGE